MREERSALDAVEFPRSARVGRLGTSALWDLFSAAQLDEGVPTSISPPWCDEPGEERVLLQLGDVLRNGEHVRVVLTAECDLIWGGPRRFPPAAQVLYVPGTIASPDPRGPAPDGEEMLKVDHEVQQVTWLFSQWRAVRYDGARQEFDGWQRIGRLRLQYALRLQRRLAEQMFRVGIPVSAPLYTDAAARVWSRVGRDYAASDALPAALARGSSASRLLLSDVLIRAAMSATANKAEKLESYVSGGGKKKLDLGGRLRRWRAALQSPEEWAKLEQGLELPPLNGQNTPAAGLPLVVMNSTDEDRVKEYLGSAQDIAVAIVVNFEAT